MAAKGRPPMTPTQQQSAALATFVACVVAGLNPSLRAITEPANGGAEYEVTIAGRGMAGILHEDIATVLRIATDHGGHAFILPQLHAEEDRVPLCIVWRKAKVEPGPASEAPAT